MTVEQWLGQDNTLGKDIWTKKYQQNGETFDQWLDRISGGNDDVKRLIEEKKFLFGGRILANRGMNKLGRKITYSNCFSGDTEIATKNGIFKLSELVGKDIEVFSFGKWRKATVKCFGEQETATLVLQKGKSSRTYRVTDDHLWYVKNNNQKFSTVKTSNLVPGDVIPTNVSKCYRTYKPSPFGVAHGAFWGDGDHTGKSRRMSFCGDKRELIPYFTPDTISRSKEVSVINGIPKIFQNYPSMNETASYLYGFLAGYFATDGSIDCRGQCVFTSSVKENIILVQNILTVLGIPFTDMYYQDRISNLTGEIGRIYYQRINAKYLNESFFILSKHRSRFRGNNYLSFEWKVKDVIYDRRIEPVYCVVEPEKNAFTLKGGILTHNCYVVTPPEDNIESIFDAAKKLARTYSYGGGVGCDLSKLSPKGAKINNSAGQTSGAVSFMDLYSLVTGLISQGQRRGALMLSLSCTHPDVLDFIHVKDDLNRVTKANISVRVTRDFMEAVKNNRPFDLSFIREETGEEIKKTVNARSVFMELAKGNWRMGEPGILFWDRIENYNLLSTTPNFKFAGVNPCAVIFGAG